MASPVRPLTLPVRDGPPIVPASGPAPLRGTSSLSSQVTSVLSTSYADSEFRDALRLLDERGLQDTADATRRRLRLDLQKEVIDSNGGIVGEFGKVAEVPQ
jgi:conserved oligomeric Golgi complex subunit 6